MIDISLCCDTNMLEQSYVVISSVKQKLKNQSQTIRFNIVRECECSAKENRYFDNLRDKNTEICFYDINKYLDSDSQNAFTNYTLTPTWYRIFLPKILPHTTNKTIYLDCDLTVNADLLDLWNIDLEDNMCAGVKDFGMVYHVKKQDSSHKEYKALMRLGLEHPENYLNGGVLVMNLQEMRKDNFLMQCFDVMQRIPNMLYLDQDTINVVCAGKIRVLSPIWNVINEFVDMKSDLSQYLDENDALSFAQSLTQPAILHYAGPVKPWEDPSLSYAELWWIVARSTPFYEKLLLQSVKDVMREAQILKILLKIRYLYTKLKIALGLNHATNIKRKKSLKKILRLLKGF